MSVSPRVARLRAESLEARPTLSTERARLMTEFYRRQRGLLSVPVWRALSFKYLLEHKAIYIGQDELIVGEKGPAPKAVPTYPEICCHSLDDLDILNAREKTSFAVSAEDRALCENVIIPFWRGQTMRELLFAEMTPAWKAAYNAGLFTEFMEQRSPGHAVLDDKIYHQGLLGLRAGVQSSIDRLDYLNDPAAYDKQEELKAMLICADAVIAFAQRYSDRAAELAVQETDALRRQELQHIAAVCAHVPANAPRTFWEALQSYWFIHLAITAEMNTWDSYSPGALDQHLYPFYRAETEQGTLSPDLARELLHCFWIKFNNQPAPPKVGVTAAESGTYTDFCQISIGGLAADGSDGVNEVSYLLLDVVEEMRLLQPSASVKVSAQTPDRFIKRAARIIRTGLGQPSIFNHDVMVEQLVRQGVALEDARKGGPSGCVEVSAFGKENYNLTGYFNIVKVLEITLNNGIDPHTGERLGLETGDAARFASFAELYTAFEKQLTHFIDIKMRGNNVIERLFAEYMPSPMMSLLVDDCIARGKDYHAGGARYNMSYIQGVGIGSLTDSLAAIKYHVFDNANVRMADLLSALTGDFADNERLRLLLLNRTPRFGNDDDYADRIMGHCFESYYNAIEGRRNTKGGVYHINLFPTTVHVYFGSVLGATPDGRKAGTPLSEGVSPVQGADRRGPTAVLKSVGKMDHVRTAGTLLNQKLTPSLLKTDDDLDKVGYLVRTYFGMKGQHIQFNVVDAATLRAAQSHPESYRSLIVRVAGYSDYFCDLGKALQDEIIARTEHEAV
jgi:trans-4-hydroxy-L-proline dehydratase